MTSFYRSKEGVEAYQKIGLPYQVQPWDGIRDQYLQKTSRSPVDINVRIITNLGRIKTGSGEFIVYSQSEKRVTPIGNEEHHFISGVGQYAIPVPRYEMRVNDDGNKERYTAAISTIQVGHSIPFSKQTLDKIYNGEAEYKDCVVIDEDRHDAIKKIQAKREKAAKEVKAVITDITQDMGTMFYVQQAGDRQKVQVLTYKELRDKSFESLYAWKHVHDEMIGLAQSAGVKPEDILKQFKEQQDRDKAADKNTQGAYK